MTTTVRLDDAPHTLPRVVLHALVARDAPVAVLLRRGPRRRTLLAQWDLRTDAVVPGQWLLGELEPGACGLSPRGDLLVYSARKRDRRFTAVSRPPYFTALAFWEERLPWTGGGFFVDHDHLVLGVTHPPDQGALPRGLTVTDVWSYFAWQGNGRSSATFGDAVLAAPAAHQGWRRTAKHWERPSPTHPSLTLVRDEAPGRPGSFRIVRDVPAGATLELGALDWADWDHEGGLVLGREGRLLRQHVRGDSASPPKVIADLTGHAFEHVIAPKDARQWPRRLER